MEGLKKIWDKTKVDKEVFTLVDDYQIKQSKGWSPKADKQVYDTYVIDPKGKVKGIMKGSKAVRATSEQVFKYIKETVEKKEDSPKKEPTKNKPKE